jgi:osmotically-inducible protein OsmY
MIRKDEQIKKEIVDQLFWDSRIDASNITIAVNNGVVVVEGNTASYTAINAALKIIWSVEGVADVINNITVHCLEDVPSDQEINTAINYLLQWNSNVDDANIKANVDNGKVTLAGTVEAYWKVGYTESIVSDIHGVIGVDNKLSVVPSEEIIDKTIAKAMVETIDNNLLMDAEDIIVDVNNGKVTMHGKVPSFMARRTAYEIATNMSGVIDVKNDLFVDRSLLASKGAASQG